MGQEAVPEKSTVKICLRQILSKGFYQKYPKITQWNTIFYGHWHNTPNYNCL